MHVRKQSLVWLKYLDVTKTKGLITSSVGVCGGVASTCMIVA